MTLILLLVVLGLVALNAFFVAAEFSLVTVRPTRVEQLLRAGQPGAAVVRHLLADLDRVLSGVQLGITIASLALGWLGELTLAQMLEPLLVRLGIGRVQVVAHTIAITLAFLTITFLHVVLGELVPKSISLQRAEKLAFVIARPMHLYMKTFRPFINLLDACSNAILRALGYRAAMSTALVHSADELRLLLTQIHQRGLLTAREDDMFAGVLELKRVQVREVMVARRDMVTLPATATLPQVLATVQRYRYDRYPVYEGSPEAVIGVLHTQDLFRALDDILRRPDSQAALSQFDLRRVVREALFVPETRTLAQLLEDFRRRRAQIALVVDEFGSVQGMVTLADIVEEVTGRVADEHAPVEYPPMLTHAGMVVDGKLNILDLNHLYQINLPRGRGFETVGGFILHRLGFIPTGGESFLHNGLRFTVLEMEGRRVARVKIEQLTAGDAPLAGANQIPDRTR